MSALGQLREVMRRDRTFDHTIVEQNSFLQGVHSINPDEPDTSHGPVLYLQGVSVSFDGFKALNDLSLYIDDGE